MSRIQAFGVVLGLGMFAVSAEQAIAGPFDIETYANVRHEVEGTEGPVLGQFPEFPGDMEITIPIDSAESNGSPVSASGSTELGSGSGSSRFGVYNGEATTTTVPDNTATVSTRSSTGSRDVFTVQSTTGQTGLVTVKASMKVSGRVQVPVTPGPVPDNPSTGHFPGFLYGFILNTPLSPADMGPNSLNQFAGRRFVNGVFVENALSDDCESDDIDQVVYCEAIDTHTYTQSTVFMEMLFVEFVIEIGEMFSLENWLFLEAASSEDGAMIEAEAIFGGLEVGPEFEIVSDSDELEKRDGIYNYGPAFDASEPDVGPVAVSEPMTLALFGFGLAGLSLARRRQKR